MLAQEESAVEERQQEADAMTMFKAGHRSPQSLDHNQRFLGYFLKDYLGNITADDFVDRTRKDLKWGEAKIAGYFLTIKERVQRKEIQSDSAHNYRDPIKILLDMNDISLNWKRLDKILPARRRKPSKGAAIPKETIKTLCSYQDRRIKAVVLTMISGGLRVGAWDYLSVGDLEPALVNEKTVCGKLTVYRDEPEEYQTRISLEAFNSLNEYLDFRKSSGEKVGPTSPLIRNLWTGDRGRGGEIHIPKRLKSTGVKRMLEDAWAANPGLRQKKEGQKRFEIKATHFGRKYFETWGLKSGLEPWQIKIFRGDILPTDLGYEGFTDQELTELYLKAMPSLSIYDESLVAVVIAKQEEVVESLKTELARLKEEQAKKDGAQALLLAKLAEKIEAMEAREKNKRSRRQ